MATPKKRTGKASQATRRANWKGSIPATTICPNGKSIVLTHTVCPVCGYYKDKVVSIKKTAQQTPNEAPKEEVKAQENTSEEEKKEVKKTRKPRAKKAQTEVKEETKQEAEEEKEEAQE